MTGNIALPLDMLPAGYGPIVNEQAAAPRKLHHEENINRQVQLCVFLRSMDRPWSEAVLSLRSLCIGLEDQTFLDAWASWRCHAVLEGEQVVWRPTNTDCAVAFDLLMALLSRWGMTFQKRTVSRTPKLPPTSLSPALQDTVEAIEGSSEATA